MKFRKKPVIIEAEQWDGGANFPAIVNKSDRDVSRVMETNQLRIDTLEGQMLADVGDWIIKGVEGEIYPCKPGIFEKTYEPA